MKEINAPYEIPSHVRYAQIGYFIFSWILFVCIIVQVYLAGVAFFDNSAAWDWHTIFIHMFEYIAIVMFVLGFIGKMPRGLIWGSLGLFALFNIQYFTAHGFIGALHPVLALVLFWWSLTLARGSFRLIKQNRQSSEEVNDK